MGAPRIDWQAIRAVYATNETCIVLLGRQAIHVLLSLFHRYEWLATFGKSEAAIEDWDHIQAIMAEAEYELGVAMPLSDIIPLIDEIEDLLRALQQHAQCCDRPVDWSDGDNFTDPVVDGVGNVPQNIIDAGYATGVDDWEGFADYKCMISHIMVDSMELTLRETVKLFGSSGEIIGGIGSVASLLGVILTTAGPVSVAIIGVLASVAGFFALIIGLGDVATEALADGIMENHDELACAIYNADGSDAAVAALKQKIDDLFSDATAAVLKNMALGPSLKALYAGRYDQQNVAQNLADAGFDVDDYFCSCMDWSCENSLLDDCSFESQGASGSWVNIGHTPTYPADAADGTYSFLMGGTGSGFCSTQYTYQEFIAPQSGTLECRFYVKHNTGIYSTYVRLERWNGFSWEVLRTYTYPGLSTWTLSTEAERNAVTEGDQLRILICNGAYYKIDRIWVYYV